MNILGIETSCDETAAAVVRDGRDVLSNVVFSQIALHRPYGGVVPEIAARNHVEYLPRVLQEAMARSGLDWSDLDAIAVTHGPGLASSLLVGLAAAKGLALRLNRPLVGINHLEAHIYSVCLGAGTPALEALSPLTVLVISGGHTCLLRAESPGQYHLMGRTVDDAAGEAFDKGANLLGLGYPGGPAIGKAAASGNPHFCRFPKGFQHKRHGRIAGMESRFCFSFSGLKTSLLYYLKQHPLTGPSDPRIPDLAASYQEAIVDTLVDRAEASGGLNLAAVGGVSLNARLREKLATLAAREGLRLILAAPDYCTDNAAMVAGLAAQKLPACAPLGATMDLDAIPHLEIGTP
jgi:N6-L-threonylcarbamoyladenine synthase